MPPQESYQGQDFGTHIQKSAHNPNGNIQLKGKFAGMHAGSGKTRLKMRDRDETAIAEALA